MPGEVTFTFKPIRVPLARTISDQELYDAMMDEVRAFAGDIKKDFEATTAKWKRKPKFEVESSILGNKVSFKVYTSSLIYFLVSSGTKRHKIYAKRGRALRFATQSKLLPGRTKNAYARYVKHPGIKKRDYPANIMRVRKPTFSLRMHAAINKAILRKRAGIAR